MQLVQQLLCSLTLLNNAAPITNPCCQTFCYKQGQARLGRSLLLFILSVKVIHKARRRSSLLRAPAAWRGTGWWPASHTALLAPALLVNTASNNSAEDINTWLTWSLSQQQARHFLVWISQELILCSVLYLKEFANGQVMPKRYWLMNKCTGRMLTSFAFCFRTLRDFRSHL